MARATAKEVSVRFWTEATARAKWRWAGHVLRRESDRLVRRTMEWRDSDWWKLEQELAQLHYQETASHKMVSLGGRPPALCHKICMDVLEEHRVG